MFNFFLVLIFFVFSSNGMQNSKKEEEGLSQSRSTALRTIDEEVTQSIFADLPRQLPRLLLYPYNQPKYLLETSGERETAIITFLNGINFEKIEFLDICRIAKLAENFTVGDISDLIEQAKKSANNNPININHLIAALFLHVKSEHLRQKEIPVTARKIIIDNIATKLGLNQDKSLTSFLNDFAHRINPFNLSSVHNIFRRAGDISSFNKTTLSKSLELAYKCEQDQGDLELGSAIITDLPVDIFIDSLNNLYQVKVKNQADTDGGGNATSGYHCLRNGITIAHALTVKEFDEKEAILKNLEDPKIINDLFGNNDSIWRSRIIHFRKTNLLKDFVHNLLFLFIDNSQICSVFPSGSGNEIIKLKLDRGWIKLIHYSDRNDDIKRSACINLIHDVATLITDSMKSKLAQNESFNINYQNITNAFNKAIAKKISLGDNNPYYKAITNDSKFLNYFPRLNNINIEVNQTSFNEKHSGEILTPKLWDSIVGQGQRNTLGEWLSIEEVQFLAKKARLYDPLASLENVFIFCVGNNLKELSNNDEFLSFVQKLKEESSIATAIVNLCIEKNFFTCVIHKKQAIIKTYLADSNNTIQTNNPFLIQFLQFLQKCLDINQHTKETQDNFIAIVPHEQLKFDLENDYIGKLPDEINGTVDYLNNTQKYIKAGTTLSNSMLLAGPPGTGKTSLVEGIAKATRRTLIHCSASSFITKWQGSGAESVNKLFDAAQKLNEPVIIFVDELDTVTKENNQDNNQEQQSTLVSIMAKLDYLARHQQNNVKIFFIGATNHYDKMAEALQSRFASKVVVIPLPTEEERAKIFTSLLQKKGYPTPALLISRLAMNTQGFSGRPIFDVVDAAIRIKTRNDDPVLDFNDHFLNPINRFKISFEKKQKEEKERLERESEKTWNNRYQMAGGIANVISTLNGVVSLGSAAKSYLNTKTPT